MPVLPHAPLKSPNGHRPGPVWKGPEVDGVTVSLLSRFLNCRERFRCYVVEGLLPRDEFYAPIQFGNLWHAMEEAFAAERPWKAALSEYAARLQRRYRLQHDEIARWVGTAGVMFPLYVRHWKEHPDVRGRRRPPVARSIPDNALHGRTGHARDRGGQARGDPARGA